MIAELYCVTITKHGTLVGIKNQMILMKKQQLKVLVIWCREMDKFGVPIEDHGIYQLNGNLALSRAIGD